MTVRRFKYLQSIFLWLWCFPQNLLGCAVLIVTGAKHVRGHYEYRLKNGSVSLGEFIFLAPFDRDDEEMLKHEMGHRAQSRLLGWLYLPVIGLPSIIWNICFRVYRERRGISYYAFYTEKWADRLGGVERGQDGK